jgi:hypothetical protein
MQLFHALSNRLKMILSSSWPGLTRPSTSFLLLQRQDVDAGTRPGMTSLDRTPYSTGCILSQTLGRQNSSRQDFRSGILDRRIQISNQCRRTSAHHEDVAQPKKY